MHFVMQMQLESAWRLEEKGVSKLRFCLPLPGFVSHPSRAHINSLSKSNQRFDIVSYASGN